ncbi:bifunctional adenosylcobinamide kinase/adenosylcobinamide-phosphate guanylyltransferase [Jannaschia rubra]|uniref:Bifunctional adenosylcobalamin biosynthesis protein n=1 Tax=Jannaschia rubra TaxID=282197 RepID=A0A0M6XRR9_9RHOB|nr:bifunctional adenosylcobinamide kinase/adenosylcobinamide-phosphate guanylyltransferase [Jannaschia rubra]CTQ33412.1 Adenosylcobinamide kinase [Jannaschia rubra]SFG01218.1 adenosylcobinamide kinase /adenosylcobinamide-phosphate guanylyltransferase [Jannaschia rubra]
MSKSTPLMLVLGHAASGKSLWAEGEAERLGGPLTYVATAEGRDGEMHARIAAHAARRGPEWTLVEEPFDMVRACAGRTGSVLVDCATMWLTNLMLRDADWSAAAGAWMRAMADAPGRFVVVSNDVGGGVTPDNALARAFQQAQGTLNQRLAAAADRVVLVTAGLPQRLK